MKKYLKPFVKTSRVEAESHLLDMSDPQTGMGWGGNASENNNPAPEAKPAWL